MEAECKMLERKEDEEEKEEQE
jgi:hypothetical protein